MRIRAGDCLKAALAAGAIAVVWSCRFLPLQDYPDWVAYADIFARLLRGVVPAGDYGLLSAPVPYAGSTLVMGLLTLVMPAEIAGKVFLSLYIGVFTIGAVYLIRSCGMRDGWLEYVPFLLLFNCSFFLGNITYLCALGLLFVIAGYCLRRGWDAIPLRVMVPAAFAVYLVHYLVFGVLILFWLAMLAVRFSRKGLALVAASLAVPACAGIWYVGVVSRDVSVVASEPVALFNYARDGGFVYFLKFKAATLLHYPALFPDFYPWITDPVAGRAAMTVVWFGILAYAALCGVSMWVRRGAAPAVRSAAVGSVVCVLVFLAAPYSLWGDAMQNPGERFVIPAIVFACAAASPRCGRRPLMAAALAAMMAVVCVYHALVFRRLDRQMGALYQALEAQSPAAVGLYPVPRMPIPTEMRPSRVARVLFPQINPLLRIAHYLTAQRQVYAQDLFWQSMIVTPRQEPRRGTVWSVMGGKEYCARMRAAATARGYRVVAEGAYYVFFVK